MNPNSRNFTASVVRVSTTRRVFLPQLRASVAELFLSNALKSLPSVCPQTPPKLTCRSGDNFTYFVSDVGSTGKRTQPNRMVAGPLKDADQRESANHVRLWRSEIVEEASIREERIVAAIVLREQERLGRQLHDTLGPQITAISMLAASLHERLQTERSDETVLAAKLLDRIEMAKVEVRTLASGLMPVEVDAEGLMSALDGLAEETESTHGVACRLECERTVEVHDNFTATRLFRIAKEAVHNAVKHADPGEIVIRLHDDGRELVLQITDDGIGLSDEVAEGNGIRIMRYRCQIIGATLDIGPGDTGGVVVTCTIQHGEDKSGQVDN